MLFRKFQREAYANALTLQKELFSYGWRYCPGLRDERRRERPSEKRWTLCTSSSERGSIFPLGGRPRLRNSKKSSSCDLAFRLAWIDQKTLLRLNPPVAANVSPNPRAK